MYYGLIEKLKKELKNIKIDMYYVLGIGFLWCGVVRPEKINEFTQKIIDVVKLHNIEKIFSGERNKGYRLLLLPDSIDIKEKTVTENDSK